MLHVFVFLFLINMGVVSIFWQKECNLLRVLLATFPKKNKTQSQKHENLPKYSESPFARSFRCFAALLCLWCARSSRGCVSVFCFVFVWAWVWLSCSEVISSPCHTLCAPARCPACQRHRPVQIKLYKVTHYLCTLFLFGGYLIRWKEM